MNCIRQTKSKSKINIAYKEDVFKNIVIKKIIDVIDALALLHSYRIKDKDKY